MRLALASLLLLSGCELFFEHGKHAGDDVCAFDTRGAEAQPPPKRNPEDLTCVEFGFPCNPECGPCPGIAEVSWNFCGHSCEGLAEEACAANVECRVVRDARCAIAGNCITDYIGCFPTDTSTDTSVSCTNLDAWSCSRNNSCSALHRQDPCGTDALCPRTFALCVLEGSDPGQCWAPTLCLAPPPACPANTTPGVANGCWSGTCIPVDVCEPKN